MPLQTQDEMTLEEYLAERNSLRVIKVGKRGNKYHARKTERDGFIFDSGDEADRYTQLRLMEQAGIIKDLELQPKFDCKVNGDHVTTYTADFRYWDNKTNKQVVEDVKGVRTEAYVVRRNLTQALFRIKIVEIMKPHKKRWKRKMIK